MWNGKTVSVILMTYQEKDSIRSVIEGFEATGVVDEIVVINNNAEPGTWEEVEGTSARQILETRQGYGWATRRGLQEATGDLLVITEPDGTFLPRDIVKLLVYSDDCDAVFGTRTTRELIWRGANMGFLLKWGNWGVAKLVEALFNTSHLSDVGCSYRLITRETLNQIQDSFTVGGSHFGPELMLLTITSGARVVEVPINYLPRVGVSAVTGDLGKAIRLGVEMTGYVLKFRLNSIGRARRPHLHRNLPEGKVHVPPYRVASDSSPGENGASSPTGIPTAATTNGDVA